jgi:zinc protease
MQNVRRSVLIALLAVPGTALAQQPSPAAPIPLDPAVRSGTLDNGLRYFVRANRQPEHRAELMLVVNAGSILEDDDQRGLAHFVEHMAFNGTENFEKQALVDYLERIGMRFGADLNAYTGFDETVYLLTVPTDTGTAVARGFDILEDWAHRITFDPIEIDKERGVVIEEWRQGQGAGSRLRDQVFPVLFRGSRYAERLPIGSQESLQTASREALVRYYEQWYRPDLMAVVAVGDFDAAGIEEQIRIQFSALTPPAEPRPRSVYGVDAHDSTLVVIATDPEATGTSVNVYYKHPVPEQGTYGAFRQSLVHILYNGMLNARLSELAREADPPFVAASSSEGNIVRTQAAYSVGAAVHEGGVLRGLEAILTEAERVARHGFAESELDREKADLLRYYESAFAEREHTESSQLANEYARAFMEGEAVPGIAAEFDLVKQYLPAITLADVNRLAGEWMPDGNRVIVLQAPRKEGLELPSERDLLGVFAAVESSTIDPYVDVVTEDELVANPPAPGSVTAETVYADVGVTEWTLSNGARVLLRPTDFKDDEVVFRAFSPGGLSHVSDDEYLTGVFASSLASASGLGTMDATALQKALAGKAVAVRAGIDELSEGLNGGASPGDLETMFQLIHLNLSAPRRDTTAFSSLVTRLRSVLENQQASPDQAFADTLSVTMAQHHPRIRPVTAARLDEIDRDRAFEIFEDRFTDAGDFTFVFVGSFTIEAIRPLVERWIGGLPGGTRNESWRDSGVRPPDGVVEKTVRRGLEPRSQTAIIFTGPIEYDRQTAFLLNGMADALDIQLRDVLREELGGTYGVQVATSVARDPWPNYAVQVYFGADPARLDSLTTVVFDEIRKMQTEGPSAETLDKVKEALRRDHETNLRQNAYWLSRLSSAALQGFAPDELLDVPALIDALSVERIAEAARMHMPATRYVRVSLVPEG